MIQALELENVKGFASRQRIDFAPITLLFGANSAGKSTIVQALLYLHEILERGTADVGRTELGGHVVELGGFERLVHRHDLKRAMTLRVDFAIPGSLDRLRRDISDFPFPDLDDEFESAWLELTIRHRAVGTLWGPVVERAVIGVAGVSEALVCLDTGPRLAEADPVYVWVNLGHPLIAEQSSEVVDAWGEIALPDEAYPKVDVSSGTPEPPPVRGSVTGLADGRWAPMFAVPRTRRSVLPQIDEPLVLVLPGAGGQAANALSVAVLDASGDADRLGSSETVHARERAVVHVQAFLEMVVLGTTAQLASSLRESLYIGPLRGVPTEGSLFARAGRRTSWADGLAAWEALLSDWQLLDPTNAWLKRLDTGCEVFWQQLFDPNSEERDAEQEHVDAAVRRLLLGNGGPAFVLPSEVGAGISQVMPVIVAAVQKRAGITLIEQPEIHVHPALQVGLGDLFIETANRDGARRVLLVETHSEHLLLRLLRRIRQTTEGELTGDAPPFSGEKLSIVYVENGPEGVRTRRLRVDERGEFKDRWPKGFFAERMEELL